MTKQSTNTNFHASSFLQGHNAQYLEKLYADFAENPETVDKTWQDFFRSLGDSELEITQKVQSPSWLRNDWPPTPNDELTTALDGTWGATTETKDLTEKLSRKAKEANETISEDKIKRAVLDSIRALMIIRAYRIRGHLAADLDPLQFRESNNHPELDPKTYGFAESDLDRPIFIDNVLGLEIASMRKIIDILIRTYCETFALQYMHISDPAQSSWLKERIEGFDKEIKFTRKGRKAILNKMIEAEGFEKFLHVKYMGTKR